MKKTKLHQSPEEIRETKEEGKKRDQKYLEGVFERLDKLVAYKNTNYNQLRLKLNTSCSFFATRPRDFGISFLNRLHILHPDISMLWLLFNEGNIESEVNSISQQENIFESDNAIEHDKLIDTFVEMIKTKDMQIRDLMEDKSLLRAKIKILEEEVMRLSEKQTRVS